MTTEKKSELTSLLTRPYNYGFSTNIKPNDFPKGINSNILKLLSNLKKEPLFIQEFRLQSFKNWKKKKFPIWANLILEKIDFTDLTYYSNLDKNLNETNSEIIKTFDTLQIPLSENQKCSTIAFDVVFDSKSINTTYKEKLAKHGIIFCSISEAINHFPHLIKKFLGSVVSSNDNFFASLNSAVFTDGSFCYIPKNIKCPLDLSTYFRINDRKSGQFERTLIIAEENSFVNYLEGCTAPEYDNNQLHAAVVELIAFNNAEIRYSTIQNWYAGDDLGKGGILNFVTKRGLCLGNSSKISWTQIETGAASTWKYPSCFLVGEKSIGEFYSIALTKNYQQTDTGTKMIHIGTHTKSKILSKSISSGCSNNTYRGLVKISSKATNAYNFSQCDSFLVGNNSFANTYPYIETNNSSSKIEYEAKISKITEEQLFYLAQRGFNLEKSLGLLISGFCKDVIMMLPLEFALEADQFLLLNLENSVG